MLDEEVVQQKHSKTNDANVRFPEEEHKLMVWLTTEWKLHPEVEITPKMVCDKTVKLTNGPLKGSPGWFQRLRKRRDLDLKKRTINFDGTAHMDACT